MLDPITKAFDYYVEMGRKMEEEKQKTQEKQAKKFSPDYERKLDKEMRRKLSREFDRRLHQEINKKFVEERERKISGDFRNMNNTGSNSRKASVDNKNDFHTPPQTLSPPSSNSPSPMPVSNHVKEDEFSETNHINNDNVEISNQNNIVPVSTTGVYISLKGNNYENHKLTKQRNSFEEKPHIMNGKVPIDHSNT